MVRRALRLLNMDEKIEVSIEPIMTKRVMKKIKRIDDMKRMNVGRLKVSEGKHIVLFD
jgi:type II secretory pathway component PulM